MAVCNRCNNQISDDAKFCTSCGALVEQVQPVVEEKQPIAEQSVAEEKKVEVTEEPVKAEEPVKEEQTPINEVEKKEEVKEPVMAAAVPVAAVPVQQPVSVQQTTPVQPHSQASQYTPAAPPVQQNVQYAQAPQPQYAQPQYVPPVYQNQDIEPPAGSKYAPVSTGAWFGLTLLLAIPVVGLITWIFLMCSKKVNLKNFAKAILIWAIISIVISITTGILCVTVLKPIITEMVDGIKEYAGSIGEYSEDLETFGNYFDDTYKNDYSEIVMNG